MPYFEDISVDLSESGVSDASTLDPQATRGHHHHNRTAAILALDAAEAPGELLTGVFCVNTGKENFYDTLNPHPRRLPICNKRKFAHQGRA